MKSKSFIITISIQVVGASIIAIVVCVLFFIIIMNSLHEGAIEGLVFGGSFSFIISTLGSLSLKPSKISLSFNNVDDFLTELNKVMSKINYELKVKKEIFISMEILGNLRLN